MHEGAAILLTKMDRAGPAHVERAIEVNGQHVRPIRPAHAVKDSVAQDAGIVDQDIDAAEGGERNFYDLLRVLRIRDRERGGEGTAADALDLLHDLLRGRRIGAFPFEARADVADDDARALAGHQ